MQLNLNWVAIVVAGMVATPSMAQTPASKTMPDMDHGAMMKKAPSTQPADGRAEKKTSSEPDASQDSMAAMDQGSMPTSEVAPADARDPHAYSGGTTLKSGPHILPGVQPPQLADEHNFASILVDQLERGFVRRGTNSTAYDAQAWFGRDYDRLVIKAGGDISGGKIEKARTEVLWGHAIAKFWDVQTGLRYDSGIGPNRTWAAIGVQGLAPYWFEVDATAYVGQGGRAAFRLSGQYELLLTQKLILQPRAEFNLYSKSDVARDLGSGLSSVNYGVRLRYEFSRKFAPYIGVERANLFGQTADLARAAGQATGQTRWVAGVRLWF